jgi:hypothetical protein
VGLPVLTFLFTIVRGHHHKVRHVLLANGGAFPDGDILATDVVEDDVESTISVYKIDSNIITGIISLRDITPWAKTEIPNNRGPCSDPCRRTTFVSTAAVAPDGIVFVSIFTTGGQNPAVRLRGTMRFEPSPDGTLGSATGFVNFETLERLSF